MKFKQMILKAGNFFKKYGYIFLIAICIISVAAMIGVAVTANQNNAPVTVIQKPDPQPTPDPPPAEEKFELIMPTSGEIINEFNRIAELDTGWQFVREVDFGADGENKNVKAIESGIVTGVGTDEAKGNFIFIKHENNYVSRYYSLKDKGDIKEGDKVEKGQIIGEMSTTCSRFKVEEDHLHFILEKDDRKVDPTAVITSDNK